jgi:uncharacterized membrane protein YeaQ/YmgE (transglycosylase-associated protein family)
MSSFADVTIPLNPGGLIAWLVVGLIAGWAAGRVMKGAGYGLVGDIVVGLVGAVIGGFLYGLAMPGDTGFWGSIVVAFCGACVLIVVVRYIALKRTRL